MNAEKVRQGGGNDSQNEWMVTARRNRHYEVSPLLVLKVASQDPKRQDVLLEFYAEICNSGRMLTGVLSRISDVLHTHTDVTAYVESVCIKG